MHPDGVVVVPEYDSLTVVRLISPIINLGTDLTIKEPDGLICVIKLYNSVDNIIVAVNSLHIISLLSPWCRVLFGKLIVTQLVKE